MCWFCDGVKKLVNTSIVIYDDTTAKVIKEYSYPDSTVTLKITAGGYRGNSHILTGMLELNGLKYCPNCGDYIVKGTNGEFYVCERNVFEAVYEEVKEPKSVQSMMYEQENLQKRYRDIANLYERLAKGGIECSMTLDDKNGICTIYCHGVELADDSERINKSFEDALEEETE